MSMKLTKKLHLENSNVEFRTKSKTIEFNKKRQNLLIIFESQKIIY